MKLCECGCGEPTKRARQTETKRGYVRGEPVRFIAGHHSRTPEARARAAERMRTPEARARIAALNRTPEARARSAEIAAARRGPLSPNWKGTPEERFGRLVGEPDENGCLPWLGPRAGSGHGLLSQGRDKNPAAYRFAYEQALGPIPEGHHLHHVCGNPSCVNPEHLMPMTPGEHARLHRLAESISA